MVYRKNSVICGLDESGRGALAGPLVAVAVLLPFDSGNLLSGLDTPLRDGKTLSPGQRRNIFTHVKRIGIKYETEIISARIINNHGIGKSNREIFRRLIRKTEADRYIVDGNLKIGNFRRKKTIECRPHADSDIPAVIIAGIIAKYIRDKIMRKLHLDYPRYGWNKNSGYGTKGQLKNIERFGVSRYHRNIFVATASGNTNTKFK